MDCSSNNSSAGLVRSVSDTATPEYITKQAAFVLYLVTAAFGIAANSLTIVVLLRLRRVKTVAACFILNLAIADDLALMALPFMAYSTYTGSWIFGEVACRLMSAYRSLNLYASIFTITLMSVDRYLAVVHPLDSLRYRTTCYAFIVCGIIWTVGALFALPELIYSKVARSCQVTWPKETLLEHMWFNAVFGLVVGYLLPVGVMAVCYSRMLYTALSSNTGYNLSNQMGNADATRNYNRKNTSVSVHAEGSAYDGYDRLAHRRKGARPVSRVTAMVFIVAVAFVVCWTPYHIINFASVHKHQQLISEVESESSTGPHSMVARVAKERRTGSSSWFSIPNTIAQALTFISSCCNPFIYYISSRNFRKLICDG